MIAGPARPLERTSVGDGRPGRLMFAQVREDPSVDVALVRPAERRHVVVVTSGGCTALAMLAGGAGRVTAVDSNHTQNDYAELVAAALTALDHAPMLGFLGAAHAGGAERLELYGRVRPLLTEGAQRRWDAHRRLIAGGPIHAGLTERGARVLAGVIRRLVQGPGTVDALLGATTLDRQQDVFDRRWNNRRWRAMFRLALNRYTCRPLYKGFFDNIDAAKFSATFRTGIDHALRDVPIAGNWYVHDLFEGGFRPDALPPHLRAEAQLRIRAGRAGLRLVDGSLATLLRSMPDGDVDGFSLSNVGEWLAAEEFAALLAEVVRVAAPGAVVVFRNFVPREAPIPASLAECMPTSTRLPTVVDRSLVRYQTVVAQVHK